MITECRTETGLTVTLIDGIMGMARIVVDRDISPSEVQEALLDLRDDESMKRLMDIGELSDAKAYIEEQKRTTKILNDGIALLNQHQAIAFIRWAIDEGLIRGDFDGIAGIAYENETYETLYAKFFEHQSKQV